MKILDIDSISILQSIFISLLMPFLAEPTMYSLIDPSVLYFRGSNIFYDFTYFNTGLKINSKILQNSPRSYDK